ncbi:hypothetical protein EB820_20485 [Brevibacillus agri]|uniref:Uncharacterized protein n=1 Tax=Brevibacillus agri TaxID=51101 RepID=A0A3M8AIC4_9BACL|nr:hypothetical protein BA6348_09590 [Brevibacillus agri]RNB50920.1 hypothetical protein EB820_20485 [Brevibacillus agri]
MRIPAGGFDWAETGEVTALTEQQALELTKACASWISNKRLLLLHRKNPLPERTACPKAGGCLL